LSEIVRNIWFYSIQVPEAKEKEMRENEKVLILSREKE
jgi:hypothetical protein